MKIEYRSAQTGSGAYTVLADEGTSALGAAISGFHPHPSKSPMMVSGYAAPTVVAVDMGTVLWALEFMVERVHTSADAAAAFELAEAANFAGNVDLKITIGAQVTYLVATALLTIDPGPRSDQSSQLKYSFTGGNYTTTAP